MRPPRRLRLPTVALGLLALTACLRFYHTIDGPTLGPDDLVAIEGTPEARVQSPLRVFLTDGSFVVLPQGGMFSGGRVVGDGRRYLPTLDSSEVFQGARYESVAAVEVYRPGLTRQGETAAIFVATTAAAALATPVLLVAIFGSCPTIYAVDAGSPTAEPELRMEAFSYSIAPLFEARDVAALGAVAVADGELVLEVRNEALETHYIRYAELLEVVHDPDEVILPDPSGRPVAIRGVSPVRTAQDRDGRDIRGEVARVDGAAFRSSPTRLVGATPEDHRDWIELEVPVDPGVREFAVVLTLRNTLLNSVLFYDVMLARSGPAALDWLGRDLDRIGDAVELGRWYQERMGMRVLLEERGRWTEVAHLSDVGPIAWKEVAVLLPGDGTASRKIRLDFVTDSWFVDRVGVGSEVRLPPVRTVPAGRVLGPGGVPDPEAAARLAVADTLHLVTLPGQRYRVSFPVGHEVADGSVRSHLLAMQGYYVEWVRGNWLASHEGEVRPFVPTDRAVFEAIERWRTVMEDFERDFHASKVPTLHPAPVGEGGR